MKWYQHDPEAFNGGTVELTLEEVGAYILILNLLYSRDANVPDDDRLLARTLRCQVRTWRRVKAGLIAKGKIWVTDDGKIGGKRVENTLKIARKFSENQAKRAGKRWEKHENPNENSEPDMRARNANTTTTTTTKKEEATNETFERFKKAYPKRAGNQVWFTARKAFDKAIEGGADPEIIIAGANRFARAPTTKVGSEFVPMAATWINQHRWEDDGNDSEQSSYRAHWEHIKAKMQEHA